MVPVIYASIHPRLRFSHAPISTTADMDPQDFEKINGMLEHETALREVIIRPIFRKVVKHLD